MHREESLPVNPLTAEAVELAFRDACESAVLRASSLPLALRCYRSAISLAARLRVERADVGLPAVWEVPLLELLDQVLIVAGEQLRAERMPVEARLRLYGLIAGLARAAQRARSGPKTRRQDPIQREDGVGTMGDFHTTLDIPPPPPNPLPPGEGGGLSHGTAILTPVGSGPTMADEAEEPAPLSAWRADHTAQRDKLAHARLKFVLEDRVYAKAHDEAQRAVAATAHAP
jgi:hypothetical protein